MSKTVSATLQAHRDTGQTTQSFLLRISPQVGSDWGVTTDNQSLAYNDGDGSITYSATSGLNISSVESSATLSVNNSEATTLIGALLSKADIAAGELDYADFYLYRVNREDTTQGHDLVQSGRTGVVRSHDDLAGIIELRGVSQQLKQNFIDYYSLSCRARFGSQVGEEKFPCNFDTTSLWDPLTVSSVGSETDREFTASATPSATGPNGALSFDTAQVTFLTGANAGLTTETESVTGAVIVLRFPTPYAIEATDTFKIRPDCQKRYVLDCIGEYDNGLNYRGEPYIPITEEASDQTPGANIRGLGAIGSTPTPIDDGSPTPPDTPPDTSGAVTFESWFGVPLGPNIGRVITKVIPFEGISIWFQVPVTADVVTLKFTRLEVTGMATTSTGAVNTGVLDFTTPPTHVWGIGGGIDCGINDPGGQDVDLTPGNIYIFNCKNDSPKNPNWLAMQVSWNVSP